MPEISEMQNVRFPPLLPVPGPSIVAAHLKPDRLVSRGKAAGRQPPHCPSFRASSSLLVAAVRSAMHSATMDHATLVGFLIGTISPEGLTDEITTEVNACNDALRAGKNGHVIITDGPSFEVTREGAKRLLAAVAEDRLPFEFASYVADCITMSDDFDFADDAVKEAVYFVADESRKPTRDETGKALTLLG
jgi:hypothetical protein